MAAVLQRESGDLDIAKPAMTALRPSGLLQNLQHTTPDGRLARS
jgi:hypothetical protein